jgi:hypothetical protein
MPLLLDDPELSSALLAEMLRSRLSRAPLVASPAAGAEVVVTVPGGTHWLLSSFSAILTPSAVAGTRNPRLDIRDGDGNIVSRYVAAAGIAPSTATRITWAEGLGAVATLVDQIAPLPSPTDVVAGGWTIRTVTASLDAADQWSAIALGVVELSPAEISQMIDYLAADFISERTLG